MTRKILIVDDEPFMLRLIQHHLENAGYEMIKARNGREAIEAATRENPCVVVMDAMMPNMDGLTALRQLKQEPATRAIPVIMLTANPHKYSQIGRASCRERVENSVGAERKKIKKITSQVVRKTKEHR